MLRTFVWVMASMLAAACSSHGAQTTGGSAGSSDAVAAGSGSAGSSAAGAGSAGSAAKPSAPPPKTVLEKVQQGAPAETKVTPAELTVPGVELFAVSDSKPAADDEVILPKLVGVTGGLTGQIVESRDLVRAAIAAKPDKMMLARVALWVAGDDGQVLDGPRSREQKKARVTAPAVTRDALAFWVWTTDVPRTLERCKLDLATGALEIAPLPVSRDAAINNAMTTLNSVSVMRHAAAVHTLAAVCEQPRARQALLAALGNHPRIKTRAAVADELHRCGAAAVDGLITAMQEDRSALVRRQAATALGRIGEGRARAALGKATRSEDDGLAWAAKNALGKLK